MLPREVGDSLETLLSFEALSRFGADREPAQGQEALLLEDVVPVQEVRPDDHPGDAAVVVDTAGPGVPVRPGRVVRRGADADRGGPGQEDARLRVADAGTRSPGGTP